jgi:hypothetical protein
MKPLKIIFMVLNLVILLGVVSLAFSIMGLFTTSIEDIVYGSNMTSFEDYVGGVAMTNSSEEQFNKNILGVMEKMELVKSESLETLDILNGVNAVVLGAGADVLSALGQEDLAAEARLASTKLQLRKAMIDHTSHLNASTGQIEKDEQMEEVKKDFDNLQRLLRLYKETENQTGEGSMFSKAKSLMEPME